MTGEVVAACSCRAAIRLVPTPAGKLMPIDVDRDPAGPLVAVRIPGKGWGVRPLHTGETPPAGLPRYTPHWATCPHAGQYRRQAREFAPQTWPERAGRVLSAAGPCARCRRVHPARYGTAGRPLCDTCRNTPPGVS